MRKALLLTILVFILGLCLGQTALAQSTPSPLCGDLSEADCSILTQASQANMGLQSRSIQFNFSLSVANVPQMPAPLEFSMDGSGAFSGQMSQEMMSLSQEATPDMTQLPQMMEDMFRSINGQLSVTVHLPPMLMQMMMMRMSASAPSRTPMPTPPSDFSFDMRMVDGIGYINLDKASEVFPTANIPSGWQGLDIAGLYRAMLERQMNASGMSEMMGTYMQQMMNMRGMGMAAMGDFVTVVRNSDTSVDGQSAAVFQFNFDMARFMSSPMMQQMITSAMQQGAGQAGSQMTQEQMQQAMQMVTQMYQGLQFSMTETVGLTDHYVHQFTMHMNWDMSALMQAVQANGPGRRPNATNAAPTLTLDFTIDLSDFNSAPTATAPEGAHVIPLEQVLPMLNIPGIPAATT